MGQYEIIKILEKTNHPMSRSEIAKILKAPPEKVSNIIKRMLKGNDIECIELGREQSNKILQKRISISVSRRTRFYYLAGKKFNKDVV